VSHTRYAPDRFSDLKVQRKCDRREVDVRREALCRTCQLYAVIHWSDDSNVSPVLVELRSLCLRWMKERRIYRSLLRNKPESFWIQKVDAEKSSLSQLWRSIDVLFGCSGVPSCDNIDAQQFHDYFDAKVAGIRSSTDGASPYHRPLSISPVLSQ